MPILANDFQLDDCKIAVQNKKATSIQKLKLKKYYFDKIITNNDLTEEDRSYLFHEVYSLTHGKKAIRNLRLLHDNELYKVLGKDYQGPSVELTNMDGAQLVIIKKFNACLGIDPSQGKEIVTKEQLVALIPYLTDNTTEIYTTFKLRNRLNQGGEITTKTAAFIVKAVYSNWCGLELKANERMNHHGTSYTTVQNSLKMFNLAMF